MKWPDLLRLLPRRTVFHASALMAGDEAPHEVSRQLSRWSASGRLIQLRREVYAVAPPYASSPPDRFVAAAMIRKPSYVSLQSALALHGAIPEAVPETTCVTTGRPGKFETPIGTFRYRHVHRDLFWGYRRVEHEEGEEAYLAGPEKALLDLVHLTPGSPGPEFLEELRLESSVLDSRRLLALARRSAKPKWIRAAEQFAELLGYETELTEVL